MECAEVISFIATKLEINSKSWLTTTMRLSARYTLLIDR